MTTIMSGLPQELIDHIIDQAHDRESLKACSLVCSQWSARSRKHLFVRVEFAFIRDLQEWCARIRPGTSGLSSLVEDLSIAEHCRSPTLFSPSWLRQSTISDAASHLQSFSGLRALEIWTWEMSTDQVSTMLHSFGSSLQNVTRLSLCYVIVHPSTFAMFVGHFPRLNDLFIDPLGSLDDTGDSYRGFHVDIVPTYPRGEFSTSHHPDQLPKGVFEVITLLEPRFHRVSLKGVNCGAWRDYWPVIEACAGSLEELHILEARSSE